MTLARTQIAKFVYVGQGGPLSTVPLEILANKGLLPEAVIIADKSQRPRKLNLLPVRPPRLKDSLASVAIELGLPVFDWQKGSEAQIADDLAAISPELVIMSCFPWRVSGFLLEIPTQGWWNLHPSSLPAHRGPTPLFWQAKAGAMEIGVSLHQVESSLDSGAVIGQKMVSALDFQGRALEVELARQGSELIEQALLALGKEQLHPRPQQEPQASYQGFPTQQDRRIETTGLASAAYRFIQAVSPAYALWFELEAKRYKVIEAVSFDDQGNLHLLDEPYQLENKQLTIQFEQGILIVLVEEEQCQ